MENSKIVTIKRISIVAYPMAGVSCATVVLMTDDNKFHSVDVHWKQDRDYKLICARPGDRLKMHFEKAGYYWIEDVIYHED